jgi:type IV secretory pathway VirB2 component (pilin)
MKNSRIKSIFFILLMTAAVPLFSQDILPAGMTSLMDSMLAIFTSGFTKAILIMCLCGCAIAYGFNKDNEKMKRNVIAIGIAIGILVGASQVVDMIWSAAQG